jgi:hypothetical protein
MSYEKRGKKKYRTSTSPTAASTLINVDSSVLNEPSRLDKRSSSCFRDRI